MLQLKPAAKVCGTLSKERREKTGSGHPYEKEVDDAVFSKLYWVNDAAKLIGEYLEIGGAHEVPLRERALVLADPSWQAAVERNNIKAFAKLRRNSPGMALDRHAEAEIHARYQQVHNQWLRYSWRNLSMRLLVANLINALDERRDPRVLLEVRAAEPQGLKHVDAEYTQSVGKKLSLQTLFSKWIRGAHCLLRCEFSSADKLPTAEHSGSTGARKLPEDRSTPFFRLLGRGRTQRRAPAELKALSDDDYENNVALPLLIRYRLELASAPASQADEEFLMNTQENYEILLLRIKLDCKRDEA